MILYILLGAWGFYWGMRLLGFLIRFAAWLSIALLHDAVILYDRHCEKEAWRVARDIEILQQLKELK